jgi:hypothetical protein
MEEGSKKSKLAIRKVVGKNEKTCWQLSQQILASLIDNWQHLLDAV